MQLVLEPKLLGVVYFLKELATGKGKERPGKEKEASHQTLSQKEKKKTKEAAEETKPKYKGSTKQRRQEETLERQRKVKAEGEQVSHKKGKDKRSFTFSKTKGQRRGCSVRTVVS